jgi:hypothetical protein
MLTKADLIDALKPIHKKLDALETGQKGLEARQENLEAGQQRLERKLDQSIEDNAKLFHQMWLSIDELKQPLEKRIGKIGKQMLHS